MTMLTAKAFVRFASGEMKAYKEYERAAEINIPHSQISSIGTWRSAESELRRNWDRVRTRIKLMPGVFFEGKAVESVFTTHNPKHLRRLLWNQGVQTVAGQLLDIFGNVSKHASNSYVPVSHIEAIELSKPLPGQDKRMLVDDLARLTNIVVGDVPGFQRMRVHFRAATVTDFASKPGVLQTTTWPKLLGLYAWRQKHLYSNATLG